ncbi:MAG: hypothetical protein GDA56_27365 [Hormoscilla sp. GM7CHS1pb]|nr:hypothetical protein [Hormoscilla sp. GM7CHS1pb]
MTKTATHNVLLAPEQYETLAQLASQEGRSISDLAQEMVRLGLETREKQKQHNLEILDSLTLLREEIYQTHGMFPGDLVAQVRAEREKQIDRVMRGEA